MQLQLKKTQLSFHNDFNSGTFWKPVLPRIKNIKEGNQIFFLNKKKKSELWDVNSEFKKKKFWVYISQLLTFFSELQETKLQFFICLFHGRNKLPRFLNPLPV